MSEIKLIPEDPDEPVSVEIMERAILNISDAMIKINNTRVTRRMLVTLIQAESKVRKSDIDLVLNNLTSLERIWLKPRQGIGKKAKA